MANNFTATQIGDSFIAKLKDPYQDIIKVHSWEIVVGLSNLSTVGKLSITQGSTSITGIGTNLALNDGDEFIIGNLTFTVESIAPGSQEFTITEPAPVTGVFNFYLPENSNNFFSYQYRWSQDASFDGGQFSEFRELNNETGVYDLLGKTFDPTKPLRIDVRLEAERLTNGSSISLLSTIFELESVDGVIESCPNWCDECEDPYAMDGCANIIIDCGDEVWNPYSVKKPSAIYRQITALSNEMWGHEVKYFRVEPDNRSRDVILMEYSLYNVVSEGTIKVMVPDNEFPTREFTFDIFGMGFDEFEIHITGEAFTNKFGLNKEPRSRDYLFFPLINRMYEVSTVALADEFNLQTTYWRVQLRKYEDRTSSIHTDDIIEQEVDDLVVGIEEVFGEEIQEEFTKTTKPQQYKTVYDILDDNVRASSHPSLEIMDAEIRNRWTLISKNRYVLDGVDAGERFALTYNLGSRVGSTDNIAITAWVSPFIGVDDTEKHVIIDGRSETDTNTGMSVALGKNEIEVSINGIVTPITLGSPLENETWYGIVINLNNNVTELGTHVYRLDPESNIGNPNQKTGTISPILNNVTGLPTTLDWNAGKGWSLSASPFHATNIRIFSKVIEQEQHINVLHQYVVRDSQLSLLTDNAIPSSRLRKYGSGK